MAEELHDDIISHLPLQLIKSETVPPAPTRTRPGSDSAADFLPEFAGHAWIAYGASPLLVISHYPNSLSEAETKTGPIFRQVIELSQNGAVSVAAVAWSPADPSVGELAAAYDDCVALFSHDEAEASCSSFCWSQTALLRQPTKVEAIKWTGSGDGIIAGGVEVVMWKRKEKSWEIAWKFKPKVAQALVSTTWFANGLSATAPWSSLPDGAPSSPSNEATKSVLICQGDGHSMCSQAELHHPVPIRMIQWRPSTGKPPSGHVRHALRPVLLTCCLDGAVRLWSEIDDGKIRRTGKDSSDQRAVKLSFCVVAVIEVNQTLNGLLGSDVLVSWATEVEGVMIVGKEACYYSCLDDIQHDTAGRCEWLIGFGPKGITSLWAVHCLDDFAPVRFPRITLWKKQELVGYDIGVSQLLLDKVLIMRNRVFGPPVVCSLVHLLPCNSFSWTQLYSHRLTSEEGKFFNDSPLPYCSKGTLKVDGHSGKILQIAIHPFLLEVQIAASLDINGMLLFWSCSTFFSCHIGLPTSTPSWKHCGKTFVSTHYTCLSWAPTVVGKDHILLLGHAEGIDCFIVKPSTIEEEIPFHKIFYIPFRDKHLKEELSRVCSIPLPSNCHGNFVSNKFLLVALWMDDFQAISWEITIDLQGICDKGHLQTFETDFDGKKYSVSVDPCSSTFPGPHNDDKVTSCAVVCPIGSPLSIERKLGSADGEESCGYAYHMTTGCINGSLKLWRSMPAQSSSSGTSWCLVGMLNSNHGPVLAVSPSACCRKIATAFKSSHPNYSTALCIWECTPVPSASSFMIEDKLCFDGEIVALNWLMLGNGQLLLGVCLKNELRVYAPRRSGGQGVLKYGQNLEGNWACIAISNSLPAISDFHWGPKGTFMVVHNEYFSVFSQFLLLADKAAAACSPKFCRDPFICSDGSKKHVLSPDFTDSSISNTEKSTKNIGGKNQSRHSTKMNVKDEVTSSIDLESSTYSLATRLSFLSMLEIAEKIGGTLPLFHPEALLVDMYSGNWKRAFVALRHLLKHIGSGDISAKGYRGDMSSNMISPIPLSNYFEGLLSPSSSENSFQWSSSGVQMGLSQFASIGSYDAPNTALSSPSSRTEYTDFIDAIERLYSSAYINAVEKMQTLTLIDLLQEISDPNSTSACGGLDEPGRRFWVGMRFQRLYFAQRFSRSPLVEDLVASSEMIGWAFHSDCHDNLFSSLLSSEPSWEEMRSMGVGFWYTNVTQLRVKMERLARQRYMKNKDPKACTLLYIALNRLQVLAGLFKISKEEKDKPLMAFLCRNFQEDKNKAAALKNAYVLMGKHQLELAIAFFLLGGDVSSAVTVCAKNFGDEQLALVICRLLEGYGGSLERSLISKFLLPSALSKGDNWMASFLEWVLGNYYQSYLTMIGATVDSGVDISVLSSCHATCSDPSIGEYCLMLAMKTSMRNAVGEYNTAVLCQWAVLMKVTSLSRCGLPLEALECLSSSISLFGGRSQGSVMNSSNGNLVELLNSSAKGGSSNWISDEISCNIISQYKLSLAMRYMSLLLREHPSYIEIKMPFSGVSINLEAGKQGFERSVREFQDNLTAAITYFHQKFSLIPLHLIDMIVLSLHYSGPEFIGRSILQMCVPKFLPQERAESDNFLVWPSNPLLKAIEEISCIFVKYVVASCKNCLYSTYSPRNSLTCEGRCYWLAPWGSSNQGIKWSIRCLGAMFQLFLKLDSQDDLKILSTIFGLFECYLLFASAWLQKNFEALFATFRPILVMLLSGNANEIKLDDLTKILSEIVEKPAKDSPSVGEGTDTKIDAQKQEQNASTMPSSPEDKRLQIISAALWVHVSRFVEHQLNELTVVLEDGRPSEIPILESDEIKSQLQFSLVLSNMHELLKLACADISFYCSRSFATYLLREVNVSNGTNLLCTNNGPSQKATEDNYQMIESFKLLNNGNKLVNYEQLCQICADPKIVRGAFLQEYRNWLPFSKQKCSSGWSDAYLSITREFDSEETCGKEDRLGSPTHSGGSPLACLSPDDHPFKSSSDKDLCDSKMVIPFHSPKEIHKRNGELLEALCINSIDECQAGLASNKKGIVFFNWEDGDLQRDKSEYIWGEADWPHNGWAGSRSVPVPTCVSPGVGLGSKKGTHLGLGGATTGIGAFSRPGKDLTGVGAFGVSSYAGTEASGLGWGVQEGFDEFVDPPATVDNVRTRAFASHPSRPFFLVGSSNTHIYLWEFGKDTATATYGVLPAANVPPPYALASVSAVRFDRCGHRFVTGALDGTVCTWQLEVGGRSNIYPTESSVCFNNYTSDVTYVTASGSIVAAAGYSSNGVNVVVWDTLAPPATSRASIMCHEGGARSLAVFDNDIGSGSISPLILTGGKGGDVGLHDFRYIATGRTKKHKQSDTGEHNINASSSVDMRSKTGDQNRNGMLWYIPKAHSGSVTKISTIPNTSFFLTGSKDGDVKLWDAKRAKLVFHWPRLHERHSFLQPSSRGFGGVVRAAVTDIQVVSHGFLTCGGDGSVKFVRFKEFPPVTTN